MLKSIVLICAVVAASAAPQISSNAIPVTLVAIGNQLYLVPVNQPQQQYSAPARPATVSRQLRPAATPAPVLEPVDGNAQFSWSYNVFDEETGDSKVASETRDGDKVTGSYSVVDPDGTIRTVTYTADAENGFRATVDRQQGPQPLAYATPAPAESVATQTTAVKRRRIVRRRKFRPATAEAPAEPLEA